MGDASLILLVLAMPLKKSVGTGVGSGPTPVPPPAVPALLWRSSTHCLREETRTQSPKPVQFRRAHLSAKLVVLCIALGVVVVAYSVSNGDRTAETRWGQRRNDLAGD